MSPDSHFASRESSPSEARTSGPRMPRPSRRSPSCSASRGSASNPPEGPCGILLLRAMSVVQAVRVDPRLAALLRDYPGHPYKKWQGAHWRLLSLVEFGLTDADGRIVGAGNRLLPWLVCAAPPTPEVLGRYAQRALRDRNGLVVGCGVWM